MKKFLKTILFLFALSSIAYAEDEAIALNPQDEQEAMEILESMRNKIKKEDAETLKLQQEAKELGITTSEAASLAEIEAMVKTKKAEKAKPKTEAEKLEATRKDMTESEKMDEEIQRIKKRMLEINAKIENYNKTNEMLDNLEKNVGELERRVTY